MRCGLLLQVRRVRCEASGVMVPKDKAIKRFIVRNIVDASAIRDIQDSSVFDGGLSRGSFNKGREGKAASLSWWQQGGRASAQEQLCSSSSSSMWNRAAHCLLSRQQQQQQPAQIVRRPAAPEAVESCRQADTQQQQQQQ